VINVSPDITVFRCRPTSPYSDRLQRAKTIGRGEAALVQHDDVAAVAPGHQGVVGPPLVAAAVLATLKSLACRQVKSANGAVTIARWVQGAVIQPSGVRMDTCERS